MFKKVYLVSIYVKSGGPRSIHQFANYLKSKDYNVEIVYYQNNRFISTTKPLFEEYKIEIAKEIKDEEDNLLIVNETATGLLYNYKKIQKAIWWLSFYYYKINDLKWYSSISLERKGYSKILQPLVLIKKKITSFGKKRRYIKTNKEFANIYHMYNSEYVHDFLKEKKVLENNTHYLCGPIVNKYLKIEKDKIINSKENIIAYNSIKADKGFMKKIELEIKNRNKNLKIIKIENKSEDEVFSILSKSKVYIDFGYHPGVERMPREAVCLYCNIITSTLGTASNKLDIPIPKDYKYNITYKNVNSIVDLICKMTIDYNAYINDFDNFRKKIINQSERFNSDIDEIINYLEKNKK